MPSHHTSTQKTSPTAILVFPHQLFKECPLLDAHPADHDVVVYIMEEYLFFRQYNFHKQKLVLHRASMMSYADHLRSRGYTVAYIESHELMKQDSLEKFLKKHPAQNITYTYTVDNWLEKKIATICASQKIHRTMYETPMFLTSPSDWSEYTKGNKKPYFMKSFYEWQRKRLGILVDTHNKPIGGRWSYDSENRKKIPKTIDIPHYTSIKHNSYVKEALEYVAHNFPHNIGSVEHFNYAINHEQAQHCIDDFIEHKLAYFGPYEDAIDHRSHILFHSVLSPYLNTGLIQPADVVRKVLAYTQKHPHAIPIESLEGFIRQIIGWREYMRLVYEDLGTSIRTKNYFHAENTLSRTFWTAETQIDPLDHTINTLLDHAYCHHIPRLMILGNIMNLCGHNPDEVYKWFMEMFIDAYDWVMVPNVYSMALYADGGLITTKPYVSSSNYILKMSDYTKKSSTNPQWALEWDALYWNFIDTHHDVLQKENRLGFVAMQYKKMDKEKLQAHKKLAREAIRRLSGNKNSHHGKEKDSYNT